MGVSVKAVWAQLMLPCRQRCVHGWEPTSSDYRRPFPTPQAFLQRCIRHNSDLELVADHWQVLSEAHQAGDTETIRAWVAEELKAMS